MTHRPTGSEPWERPAPADRAAHSDAVERRIRTAAARIADPGLRRLLEGTLPNTLDTTIVAGGSDERPDTFVLTGDIDAMWLRDSSAQVWPYLASVRGRCRSRPADSRGHPPPERPDPARPVRERVPVRRPAQRVGRRPDRDAPGRPRAQVGAGLPARVLPPLGRIRERQPLAPAVRRRSGEDALEQALRTLRTEQRLDGASPYRFHRPDGDPDGRRAELGQGASSRPNGMVHGAFRPSDDASVLPLNVPVNLALAAALDAVAPVAAAADAPASSVAASALASEIRDGVATRWARAARSPGRSGRTRWTASAAGS